ncbi:hypothetical protein QCA50_000131 [Cerrena zonata]|uniref:Uncharacterized protein n=1 Tax=Cerrena zonata TaxID=2478898 RepID=A0AAW0GW77_9APHY
MCCAYGSRDQAIAVCPMCKVFKPSASRCPHKREVCRNRALHPKHDVVYLKNPEVQLFSGCGYCKWAKLSPAKAGFNNNGWPGCCRPPSPEEHKLIGAADWPAVSLIHRVPIPPDIKALLDSISAPTPSRGNGSPPFPTGSLRGNPTQSPATPPVRRSSYNVTSPNRFDTLPLRTAPVAIPGRIRPGGSPPQLPSALDGNALRDDDGDTTSSSLPEKSTLDQLFMHRRSGTVDARVDKRDVSHEPSKMSPGRKYVELGGSLSRRGSESRTNASITRRPSISAAIPSMQVSKVTIDAQPLRRHTTPTNKPSPPTSTLSKSPSPPASKSGERPNQITPTKRSLEHQMAAVSLSSASSASSDSSGSNSESTVISDGGFTDYLSDESEAELQRQAEIKAAQLAQNHMEELEFRAARQQLAGVGLQPPKSWASSINATPRSQPAPHSQNYAHNAYSSRPYGLTSASRG